MMVQTKLAEIQKELSRQFQNVTLKGQGLSSFLNVTNKGRGLEISEPEGNLWLEFWEKSEDEDAGPVKELTVESGERAIQEAKQWLG